MTDPSIVRFRAVVESGLAALEARREEVNDLNVFPVADGDTGDNMVLTLRAVLQELDRLLSASEDRTVDDIGRNEIVASVARAALLGARGNSGVILSQLIRGAAEELASRPGELVDPVLISAALARAADQAYGSVREPAEGTILTVVREMAVRVASDLAHIGDGRLGPDITAEEQNVVIAEVIERALSAAERSVQRGPDLLPVLREAGVVDAGGYGLTVLLAGIIGALRGGEPPPLAHQAAARVTHPQHASTTYRYCTNFAVTGSRLEQRRFIPSLERIGDSVLVVGDQTTLKVHVHTDDPDAATALFADAGTVSHLDVADMRQQVQQRDRRLGEGVPADRLTEVDSGDRQVQRRLFFGLQLEVGKVVGVGVDPIPQLLLAADGHHEHRHPLVPQQPLVALEGLAPGAVGVRVPRHPVGDLTQAQRMRRVEEHQQQVSHPLKPIETLHRGQSRTLKASF